MVTGIPATLLNNGKWEDFNVIALLVQADPRIPDHRAGAKVVQTINKLLPHVKVDIGPLISSAEEIEKRLKTIRSHAKVVEQPPITAMYR